MIIFCIGLVMCKFSKFVTSNQIDCTEIEIELHRNVRVRQFNWNQNCQDLFLPFWPLAPPSSKRKTYMSAK